MSKHDHTPQAECAHELKHCTPCKTVYCDKCGAEWKRYSVADLFGSIPPSAPKSWGPTNTQRLAGEIPMVAGK